jgi:hypothetical protein
MSDKAQPLAKPEPVQKTAKGVEIPVPKREDVERDLAKLVGDAKPLEHRSPPSEN